MSNKDARLFPRLRSEKEALLRRAAKTSLVKAYFVLYQHVCLNRALSA